MLCRQLAMTFVTREWSAALHTYTELCQGAFGIHEHDDCLILLQLGPHSAHDQVLEGICAGRLLTCALPVTESEHSQNQ